MIRAGLSCRLFVSCYSVTIQLVIKITCAYFRLHNPALPALIRPGENQTGIEARINTAHMGRLTLAISIHDLGSDSALEGAA